MDTGPTTRATAIPPFSDTLQVGSRFVDIPGIMVAMPLNEPQSDDPRKLRALLDKVVNLADDHRLTSVLVGMSGAGWRPDFSRGGRLRGERASHR